MKKVVIRFITIDGENKSSTKYIGGLYELEDSKKIHYIEKSCISGDIYLINSNNKIFVKVENDNYKNSITFNLNKWEKCVMEFKTGQKVDYQVFAKSINNSDNLIEISYFVQLDGEVSNHQFIMEVKNG